jgi:lysylphosphatidylglycerol synthetase-like protein (DUF2156 family)
MSSPTLIEVHSVDGIREELAAILDERATESGQRTVLGPYPWKVLFNDDRSAFANLMEGTHAIVSWRSPTGLPADQALLTERLYTYARQQKKTLFAIGYNDVCRQASEAFGLISLRVGVESSFNLAEWSTAGKKRQNIRLNINHATTGGMTWREAFPRTSEEDRLGISGVEEAWEKERPQRKIDTFLRTAYTDLIDIRRYFVAEQEGRMQAVTTCTPISKTAWYLQDLTRLADSARGSLEGAMVLALNTFKEEGIAVGTNGLLPDDGDLMREAGRPQDLGVMGNRVIRFFDKRYQFGGISKFRIKFSPDGLEPSYLLRPPRAIRPGAIRSLIKLLT